MYTRKYLSLKNYPRLNVAFENEELYALQDFLFSETHNFAPHIVKELDDVLSGRKVDLYFSGNMSFVEGDSRTALVGFAYEELGPDVVLPTAKLKELVYEWIEMEDKFKKGELEGQLPLVIED
ncbi:hypothetical protein [Streptococcus oricebi]|uniref:Uncharacterized protein n=1 Tax=Streptococcus oricebi TaxID=1547447 RepID=A0ABS5B325_9STRE|nr:hypothetical protein [Streptococcus oricebi]MBP2623230.1 hypothetical protein [Streptococcus oricebi]